MRIYVIRHGQTAWNQEARAQGHADIPLDAEGERQAAALGRRMQGLPPFRLLSSDLMRAVQTARAIQEPETTEMLRERAFGEWEGRLFPEFREQLLRAPDPFTFAPPGGESVSQVWERLKTVVQTLREANDDYAIVTHGGSGALLIAQLLAGTYQTARGFSLGNCSVTQIERRPDGSFFLVTYNDLSHLKDPALQGGTDGS